MTALHMNQFKRVSISRWGIHYSLRELRVLFTLTNALHSPMLSRTGPSNDLTSLDPDLRSRDSASSVAFLDNRRGLGHISAENRLVDEVRHRLGDLVVEVLLGWHTEDLVQFFKRELLGLSDETEDHKPGDQVEASVESEGAGLRHD